MRSYWRSNMQQASVLGSFSSPYMVRLGPHSDTAMGPRALHALHSIIAIRHMLGFQRYVSVHPFK